MSCFSKRVAVMFIRGARLWFKLHEQLACLPWWFGPLAADGNAELSRDPRVNSLLNSQRHECLLTGRAGTHSMLLFHTRRLKNRMVTVKEDYFVIRERKIWMRQTENNFFKKPLSGMTLLRLCNWHNFMRGFVNMQWFILGQNFILLYE